MPLANIDIEVKNLKREQFENNCLLMQQSQFSSNDYLQIDQLQIHKGIIS